MKIALWPRACPICGPGASSRLFAPAHVDLDRLDRYAFAARKIPEHMHWRLRECCKCDLLFADPAPAPDDLTALYQQAAFAASVESRHASETYGRLLRTLLGRLPDRVGALDVGTGDGSFLRQLQLAGFTDVVGLEPSAEPVAGADPRSVRSSVRKHSTAICSSQPPSGW